MPYECPKPRGFLVNTYMFMNGTHDPEKLGQRDVKVEPLYSQAQMDAAIARIAELEALADSPAVISGGDWIGDLLKGPGPVRAEA